MVGPVEIHRIAVLIKDRQIRFALRREPSIRKALCHGVVVGGFSMPGPQVIVHRHRQADNSVGQAFKGVVHQAGCVVLVHSC